LRNGKDWHGSDEGIDEVHKNQGGNSFAQRRGGKSSPYEALDPTCWKDQVQKKGKVSKEETRAPMRRKRHGQAGKVTQKVRRTSSLETIVFWHLDAKYQRGIDQKPSLKLVGETLCGIPTADRGGVTSFPGRTIG